MSTGYNDLIAVGRITGTHGIRGQLRMQSYSGNLESLKAVRQILLRQPDGGTLHEYDLQQATRHGGAVLLTLTGFDNINQVMGLVGNELCLRRDQLPPPEADEYYWHDLLGLTVVTDLGVTLGSITDILETGANDIYVVAGKDHEYLIPAVASVIAKIDLTARTMTVTPLEGLLEL